MRKVTMLAVLAAVAATGCGGGGSGGIANFVGDWDYSGGTITQSCTGSAPEAMNLLTYSVSTDRTGNLGEISYQTSFDAYGCTRYLSVSGNTATMTSAIPCSDRGTDPIYGPYTLLIQPQSETLTYQGGGNMRENQTNTLSYTYDTDGFVLNCTSSITSASLVLFR